MTAGIVLVRLGHFQECVVQPQSFLLRHPAGSLWRDARGGFDTKTLNYLPVFLYSNRTRQFKYSSTRNLFN